MELFIPFFLVRLALHLLYKDRQWVRCDIMAYTIEIKVQFLISSVEQIEPVQHPFCKVWVTEKKAIVSLMREILELYSVNSLFLWTYWKLYYPWTQLIQPERSVTTKISLKDNHFKCNTHLYLHAAVCWANIPWHRQRHITAGMILEIIYSFPTLLWDRNEVTKLQVIFTISSEFRRFLWHKHAASHSPVSEVPPMWIPVPWHRFLSLSGAAAARAPSAWLISFILVASKEARGVGKKGASVAVLLVQKRRSLSCAVYGSRGLAHFVFRISRYGELQGAGDVWCFVRG